MTLEADDGRYRITIDDRGNITELAHGRTSLRPPLPVSHYEVNESPVRLRRLGGGAVFGMSSAATGNELPVRLRFTAGRELDIHLDKGDAPGGAAAVGSWSMTLALPLDAEFHIPEYPNIGRKLDRTMPVADFYATKPFYNFLLVGCEGVWIRFLSLQRRVGRLGVHIERHDEMFLLTVTWTAGTDDADGADRFAFSTDGRIALFASMQEALADYDRYLEQEVGVKPRACGNPLPEWVRRTRLSVAIDVMHCYGKIENDYRGVAKIARDLKRAGAPPETIVHLVGFNGPFDSMYPTYRPVPELGGEDGFREMVKVIHECGYRLSLHVNGCCIDPYHPDIDTLMPFVRRDRNGKVQGYKLAADKWPPSRSIRFHTDEIALRPRDGRSAEGEVTSPALCESMVTVGGLGAQARAGAAGATGRISITINGRTHRTPAGASLEEYRFPFPVHLDAGRNTIELASPSDIDWSRGWFRVESGFVPDSVHAISTIPILIADTTNPGYISLFCDEMDHLVTTYGIDLLYIDYTTFYHPNGSLKLFEALCRRLPDTPFSVEWCDSIEELGWFVFCGGARQHLVKGSSKVQEVSGRKQVPVTRGVIERYGWLDVTSPVCDFVKRYAQFKAGGAFVPINWVASIYPNYIEYADPAELREILDDAGRLNFLPALRLNYGAYGIDRHMKSFLRDL